MKKKLTPYLFFGAGVYVGSIFSAIAYMKFSEKLKTRMEKVETISKLVLDMDNWMWETIDKEEDTDIWVEELKNKLSYIEMIIALYYMED